MTSARRDRPGLLSLAAHTTSGIVIFQVSIFLAAIVVARELGPAGQGRFQLLIALSAMLMNILTVGIDEGLAYQISDYQVHHSDRLTGIVGYAFCYGLAVSLLGGITLNLFAQEVAATIFGDSTLTSELRLVLFLLPGMMLLNIGGSALRGLGRSDLRGLVSNYLSGPVFLAVVVYLAAGRLSLIEVEVVRTTTYIAAAILAASLVFREIPTRVFSWPKSEEIKSLHTFGASMVSVRIAEYVVQQPTADILIVGGLGSASAVGTYYVSAKVGSIIGVVVGSLTIVMGPALREAVARGDQTALLQRYSVAASWMALLGSFIGVAVIVGRRELLSIFGEEYIIGEPVLIIFAIAQTMTVLAGPNTPLLIATGWVRTEMALTATFSVAIVVLGLVLGHAFGPEGVAVASAGAFVGLALSRYRICVRRFSLRTGRSNWLIGARALVAGAVTEVIGRAVPWEGLTLTSFRGGVFAALFLALNYKDVAAVRKSATA